MKCRSWISGTEGPNVCFELVKGESWCCCLLFFVCMNRRYLPLVMLKKAMTKIHKFAVVPLMNNIYTIA